MSLKDSWKETGTGLGHAFRDLGKTVIKSAKTGADKAENWAMKDDNQNQTSMNQNQQSEIQQSATQQSVTQQSATQQSATQQSATQQSVDQQSMPNQNTKQQASLKSDWKNTGVGLGHAFRDLGKTVIKSAKTGADKAEEWATRDDKPDNK